MAKRKQKAQAKGSEPRIPNMGAAAQSRYDTFVEHYFATNQNGTAAAMLSGYSKRTAASIATDLLKHPYIAQKVEARRKERLKKIHASAEETLQIISRQARFDLRKLFHAEGPLAGTMKMPHELDDETALALDGLDIERHILPGSGRRGHGATTVENVKYKGSKRLAAADMLMKHHGQYQKDNEQRDPENTAAAVRERLAAMEGATAAKPGKKP